MSGRKRKKHDYADRLKYMRLLESGRSFNSISKEFGINRNQLCVLWDKYQMHGVSGLQKGKQIKADFALKKKILLDIEENHLTLHAASLKYGASPQMISVWLRMYREQGWTALEHIKKRSRPPSMGRPKKNSKLKGSRKRTRNSRRR